MIDLSFMEHPIRGPLRRSGSVLFKDAGRGELELLKLDLSKVLRAMRAYGVLAPKHLPYVLLERTLGAPRAADEPLDELTSDELRVMLEGLNMLAGPARPNAMTGNHMAERICNVLDSRGDLRPKGTT